MKDGLEIGVIGAGWWAAQFHIPNLLANPHVSAVSVVNPDPEALERVMNGLDVDHGFPSAEAMLAERQLDGVMVASPHIYHAEQALLAIRKGLPVVIEKPMATSSTQARAIEREAADRKVPVLLSYGWNFKPITENAHTLVAEGRIGQVRHLAVHMGSALQDLFAGRGLAEAEKHLIKPSSSTWADPARAGGYGWGQLTHALGALFRIVDLDPSEVYARIGKSPTGVDSYDAAVVSFRNGASMTLSGAGTVPKSRGYQLEIRIFGSEGMLLYDLERPRLEAIRHDGRDLVADLPKDAGAYDPDSVTARFVEICRGASVVNPADATVGRRATEVLDAMYRSAQSGTPEEV